MLDVQTMLFAGGTARAGFLLIFLIASFRSEARTAFRFWSASITASAIGVLLIYGEQPDLYLPAERGTIIYAIIGFSLSSLWAGSRAFFKRPVSMIRFAIMGLVPGIVCGGAHLLGLRPDMVLLLVIATLTYSTAVPARAFLSRDGQPYLPSQLLVGAALAAYSLALTGSVILVAIRMLAPGAMSGTAMADVSLSLFIDQSMSVLIYVGLVAMSLEDAQARLTAIATIDPLTGLANRRGVESRTVALIGDGRRANRPLAILIADLDHFKSINDRYGHGGGDAVLRAFADRLSAHCRRAQDVAGRWGGEEFLAVLGNMTLEQAVAFAEQLCLQVAQEPFDIGDQTIPVTVSIGVAEIDDQVSTLEQAVKKADEALYDAKRNGRNRVCSGRPPVLRDIGIPSSLAVA